MITRLRSEAGTQLVEMAILTPFLVLLALGATDFARVSYTSITLTHAARAGAQFGIHNLGNANNTAGIQAAARAEANDLTGSIGVTSNRFCRCPGSGTTVSCTVGSCGGGAGKETYVRVTATRTFTTLAPYPGIPNSIALTREAVLRVQ